jgi:4a-hydroxytetrahydrobiopterin dehydratase
MPDESLDPTALLDEKELHRALAGELSGWWLEEKALTRTVRLADFRQAMELVQQVADLAEDRQHHPDIDIRYNRVRFALISHDAGAITRRDLLLAAGIEKLIANYQKKHTAA